MGMVARFLILCMVDFQAFTLSYYSAWIRTRIEYKGLKLGYFWELLSLLFVVGILSAIWGRVLDSTSYANYFWYVLAGFSVWGLMSRCLDHSISYKNRLGSGGHNSHTSLEVEFLTDINYCFIQFFLSFPVILIASMLFNRPDLGHLSMMLLALVCIYVTSYSLFKSLGVLTLFFEDIAKFIRMILRVAFLMTPILWKPEMMLPEQYKALIYINPFFSFLDVFRSGLLGREVDIVSVEIMLISTVLISAVGYFVFRSNLTGVLSYLYFKR